MCLPGGGDGGAAKAAAAAKKQETQRRANIETGTASIDSALAPFDDTYFSGLSDAYTKNAEPKLDQQFADAQKQLVYALSRGGLLQSSVAADKERALNDERAGYERDIASGAQGFANQGRTNLEKTRSDLISQLGATEDPAQASNAAAREAGLLNAPPSFDPLGNFVFDAAQGLNTLSNNSTGGRGFSAGGPTSFLGGNTGSASYSRVS